MERMTSVCLPGHGPGIAEYGRQSAPHMIEQLRAYARHQKEKAEAILAASDAAFQVETYVGVHVQRHKHVVQAAEPVNKLAAE